MAKEKLEKGRDLIYKKYDEKNKKYDLVLRKGVGTPESEIKRINHSVDWSVR